MIKVGRILEDIDLLKQGESLVNLEPEALYFVKGFADTAGSLSEQNAHYWGKPEQVDLVVTGKALDGGLDKVEFLAAAPMVVGPTTLAIGVTGIYQVTNHDENQKYEVLAYYPEDLLISESGEYYPLMYNGKFQYTPVDSASQGFTINGYDFAIEITDPKPAAPVITSPLQEAVGINPSNILITTSDFQMNIPGAEIDTFISSDWEVATDPNFENIVFSSYEDSVNLTSIVIP